MITDAVCTGSPFSATMWVYMGGCLSVSSMIRDNFNTNIPLRHVLNEIYDIVGHEIQPSDAAFEQEVDKSHQLYQGHVTTNGADGAGQFSITGPRRCKSQDGCVGRGSDCAHGSQGRCQAYAFGLQTCMSIPFNPVSIDTPPSLMIETMMHCRSIPTRINGDSSMSTLARVRKESVAIGR